MTRSDLRRVFFVILCITTVRMTMADTGSYHIGVFIGTLCGDNRNLPRIQLPRQGRTLVSGTTNTPSNQSTPISAFSTTPLNIQTTPTTDFTMPSNVSTTSFSNTATPEIMSPSTISEIFTTSMKNESSSFELYHTIDCMLGNLQMTVNISWTTNTYMQKEFLDTLNNSGNYDLMFFDPYAPRDMTVPFDMPVLSLELPTCLDQSLLPEEYDGICQSNLPLSPMTSSCHTIWTPLCVIEEEALKLIQEILTNLQWTTVVLIHDTASELPVQQLSASAISSTKFIVYNIDFISDTEFHEQVHNIYKKFKGKNLNFLVMCEESCLMRVLLQTNLFDIKNFRETAFTYLSRWLIYMHHTSLAIIERYAEDITNIAVISVPSYVSGNPDVLYRAFPAYLHTRLSQEIVDIGLNVTTDLAWTAVKEALASADQCPSCCIVEVSTLLYVKGGRQLSSVGCVTSRRQINIGDIFPNIKNGFNGRQFVVSTLEYPPYWSKQVINRTVVYSGFCMDLLTELSNTMNFSYVITEPPDGEWGRVVNGSWTGFVGQLYRKEVDLSVAPLAQQIEREDFMDFAMPFYYDDEVILLKKPDPATTKWRTLIDPFQWQVFMCIGFALPIAALMLYVFETHNPYYETKKSKTRKYASRVYPDAIMYLFGALVNQGGIHLPGSVTGRTLVSFWWLFTLVVTATYSGNLIAYLTVTIQKPPFTSTEDMLHQTQYTWGTLDGTYLIFILEQSNLTLFKGLRAGIERFSQYDNTVLSQSFDVHIDHVRRGGYAFMTDLGSVESLIANDCQLIIAGDRIIPLPYAIGLPDKSPYTALFSETMLKIHSSGLLQAWRQKWWSDRNLCTKKIITKSQAINILDVQSAFYLLAIGTVLSALIMACEILSKQMVATAPIIGK